MKKIIILLIFLITASTWIYALDENHLIVLKKGKETWNHWRKENQKINPDLSGAKLQGLNLSGYNLYMVNLQNADLSKANLSMAQLGRATLKGAILKGANLRKAQFWQTELTDADFTDADLSGADMASVIIHKTIFINARMSGVSINDEHKTYLKRQKIKGFKAIQWQDSGYGGM
ncbi:MAG TPA: pentapeptide repeat-containing protein [Spirochaetota bacterium]|nr:pentapeptide repeat-containing protein [Spirochaetota bacterium]